MFSRQLFQKDQQKYTGVTQQMEKYEQQCCVISFRQREEKRQKLLAEKNKYQKGYWNAQSVSLGGLGKDPSLPNVSGMSHN